MRTGRIGNPQTRAKIVRIRNPIKHQQQRRSLNTIEQLGKVLRQRQIARARHYALVPLRMRKPPQPRLVSGNQADSRFFRHGQKLVHPAIAAALVVIDFFDRR
ncbi:hypothetical protein PPGU19_020070 [Paraburkholderia sp. PGU19]|nr:hypothetical protein PPGU19_020070 [Paraburkholderia sp. PGU19]